MAGDHRPRRHHQDAARTSPAKPRRAEFEVVDSWARGPLVVNDRVDRFTLPDQSMEIPVVGVFHMIDGKIAEWTDYTF